VNKKAVFARVDFPYSDFLVSTGDTGPHHMNIGMKIQFSWMGYASPCWIRPSPGTYNGNIYDFMRFD